MDLRNRQEAILKEHLMSKAWRLNNLYRIKDKFGDVIRFNMNAEQRDFFSKKHTRNIILKARQLGFTTKVCIDHLDTAMFEDGDCGMIADTDESARSLFRTKTKFAYEQLPKAIKMANPAKNDNSGELVFRDSGSVRIATTMRGGTLKKLHISEFGRICARFPHRADELISGTFEAVPLNSELTIESTAEGSAGHFFDYCETAKANIGKRLSLLDYKFFFYEWYLNPEYTLNPDDSDSHITKETELYFDKLAHALNKEFSLGQMLWYQTKAKGLGDKMKREYPSTPQEAFEVAIEGAYYSEQFKNLRSRGYIVPKGKMPNNRHLPVHTFWDLGVGDSMAIFFVRQVGSEFHFIDYYENSGEGFRHYFRYLKERAEEKGYKYGTHYAPHDIQNREMASDAKSRKELALEGYDIDGEIYSIDFEVVPRAGVDAGIEYAREILPYCVFDDYNCGEAVKKLEMYRKEWDDKRGIWKDKPLHDSTSHCADAFRYFAVTQNMANNKGTILGGSIY